MADVAAVCKDVEIADDRRRSTRWAGSSRQSAPAARPPNLLDGDPCRLLRHADAGRTRWRPCRCPDARTLVIQPWEAAQLKAIEKAIMASDLGLTPVNDGKIDPAGDAVADRGAPQAAGEDRAARSPRKPASWFATSVATRTTRLKAMAKDKKISEDEERRGHDQIQKTTDRFIAKVDELLKKKEQEILSF